MELNEKRPERVLQKGSSQEATCPTCQKPVQAANDRTSALCSCGQQLNWGLRK